MTRSFRSTALASFTTLTLIAALAVACGSQTSADCGSTENGKSCRSDGDCCSGYCKVYADVAGAFCQAKVANPPKGEAGTFCTADSHCASGLCNGGSCFGTPPQPGTCDIVGSQCIDVDACCTGVCKINDTGRKSCAYGDGPLDAGAFTCGTTASQCQFPSDCCSGFCIASRCASKSGGGGGNCGGAGAQCRSGIDCCSGQCTKLGSGSVQCR